jgi:hypothetical protein
MLDGFETRGNGAEDVPSRDARLGQRALEALQMLLARFLFTPEVTLLDVGSDPGTGGMVVRVHVRSFAAWSRLGPPEDLNGIPVRAVVPDDDLEG